MAFPLHVGVDRVVGVLRRRVVRPRRRLTATRRSACADVAHCSDRRTTRTPDTSVDSYRRKDVEALGLAARWLDPVHAANACAFSDRFCSTVRYGLDPASVSGIEHIGIASLPVAQAWLKARFPADGTVQVVFGKRDVCVLDAAAFLDTWTQLFAPARDDVFVLHNRCRRVLFYCHEDVVEVGDRRG
jgi:hypothetical protein